MGAAAERTSGVITAEQVTTVLPDVEDAMIADDRIAAGHQVCCGLRRATASCAVDVLVIGDGTWGASLRFWWDDLAEKRSDAASCSFLGRPRT